MLDLLRDAYLRAYLDGVTARASAASEALDWLDGTQDLNPTGLVPPFEDGSAGASAWMRLKRQVQSLGPRAFRFKRDGSIGSINWGGDDPDGIDERLSQIDLHDLASQSLKSLFATGIAAAWAYQPESGEPRIQRLGGHIEPLYHQDDAAGEMIGLFQVRAQPGGNKYTLRVYEFSDEPGRGNVYEWRDAGSMYEVGKAITKAWEDTSVPRVQMTSRSQDGLPLGEFAQALPIVQGEVAAQLRILRVADSHAWPLLYAAGSWDIPSNLGQNSILVSPNAGDALGRVEAGSLEQLFTVHDRAMERFRADAALPIASISTGNFPSGEALEQANATYLSSCRAYANMLSALLTEVVGDYAELLGISRDEAPPVSVAVNHEFTKSSVLSTIQELYRDGLVEFAAAVRAASVYVPTWSSEEVEKFIEAETARLRPPPFVPGALEDDDGQGG